MVTFDLTGTWRGHYEQGGRRHGIEMRVVQRGQSFVGSMRDADTLMSTSTPVQVPAADGAQQVAAEAEVVWSLPELSTVEGEVERDVVRFDKVYRGSHHISVWVEGQGEMSVERPCHRVEYHGRLDAAGAVLRGRWRIPPADADDEAAADRFELHRLSAPA